VESPQFWQKPGRIQAQIGEFRKARLYFQDESQEGGFPVETRRAMARNDPKPVPNMPTSNDLP
jgi:hypothetical protein